MTNHAQMKGLIRQFSGQDHIITIPALYIKLTGDYGTAALLNQLVYWSDKTKRTDGFFYKTYPDWEDELFQTERQVRYAINKLKKMELVETKLKKANGAPTLHYKIDMDKLSNSILTLCQNPILQNVSIESDKSAESLTEITTEITTKTSTTAEEPSNLTREQKEMQMLKSKNAIRFIEEDLSIRLSPIDYQSIGFYSDDFEKQDEIINYAGMIASERNAKSWGFMKNLLNEWLKNKCTSLEDVMLYEKNKYAKKKNYTQKPKKENASDVFQKIRQSQGAN